MSFPRSVLSHGRVGIHFVGGGVDGVGDELDRSVRHQDMSSTLMATGDGIDAAVPIQTRFRAECAAWLIGRQDRVDRCVAADRIHPPTPAVGLAAESSHAGQGLVLFVELRTIGLNGVFALLQVCLKVPRAKDRGGADDRTVALERRHLTHQHRLACSVQAITELLASVPGEHATVHRRITEPSVLFFRMVLVRMEPVVSDVASGVPVAESVIQTPNRGGFGRIGRASKCWNLNAVGCVVGGPRKAAVLLVMGSAVAGVAARNHFPDFLLFHVRQHANDRAVATPVRIVDGAAVGELVVRSMVIVQGQSELREVVAASGASGVFANVLQSGKHQADQHTQDRNDGQEFNQRERRTRLGWVCFAKAARLRRECRRSEFGQVRC